MQRRLLLEEEARLSAARKRLVDGKADAASYVHNEATAGAATASEATTAREDHGEDERPADPGASSPGALPDGRKLAWV